jgi:hypothetical protein
VKRFRMNWAVPGLLGIILVIMAVAWIQTQAGMPVEPAAQADQCAACHTMGTHVSTWQESTHKNVACTDCHAEKGALGWVQMQLDQFRMESRKDEADVAHIATEVPNERCINCHAREMPWVMQDLKPAKLDEKGEPIRVSKDQLQHLPAVAGHDVHLTMENPLSCTECHSGVSHGPAAQDRPAQVERMHNLCLDCHAQENVALDVRSTISCSACHLEPKNILPKDHKSATFSQSHGKSAIADVTSCQVCHLNPGIAGQATEAHGLKITAPATKAQTTPAFPPATLSVPDHMQLQDDCAACHGITMPHPQQWLSQHAGGFQEKPELCATCHGDRDQGLTPGLTADPKELATKSASCTGCHAQPMPHPENWIPSGAHGDAAKLAPATCDQCHSSANPANPTAQHASPKFCQECHQATFQHPSGYVAQHSRDLARYGGSQTAAGCTQCHTPAENSCTACHTAGVGRAQQWHPESYVAGHKDTLARFNNNQSAAGCTQCHTSSDPKAPITACTTCHTAGVGTKTKWHPDMWWVGHARTTKPSDAASCNSCHTYIEPSCSQCHTKY